MNLTEEQQQRLNKLRDRKQQALAAAIDNYEFRPLPKWGDVDFLLSLLDSQAAEGEQEIRLLTAERAANAARVFCEEVQEDAEGVPQPQLKQLNEALDAWEAYPDARKSLDDTQPILAALAALIEDQRDTPLAGRDPRQGLIELGVPDWKIDGAGEAGSGRSLSLAEYVSADLLATRVKEAREEAFSVQGCD